MLCAGCAHAAAPGGVYVVEDDSSILLSDRAWLADARPVVATCSVTSPPAPHTRPFDEIVTGAARRHALPAALLHAVIAVESRHLPGAVSHRGAMGLMQLMPATARSLGVTQPFDPEQNIHAGARHLRRLLDEFAGDTRLALAAYNAGAAAVYRHGRSVPPFPETQAYVPRVLALMAGLAAPAHRPLSTAPTQP